MDAQGKRRRVGCPRATPPSGPADIRGHESSTTTMQSYVKPEAAAGARQRRVMTVLKGGRLAS